MKAARFFWRYVTYRKDLGIALLDCALVTAAAELTIPWLLRQAIDTALGEMSGTSLEALGLWMIGVIVLLYIAHTALLRVETHMIYEASYDLRQRLYTHIHSQAFALLVQSVLYRKLLAEMDHTSLEVHKVD